MSTMPAAQNISLNAPGGHGHDFQLSIVGYNYTDREIDHYSIDGASGGAIRLSSPTSGGSGITCCLIVPSRVEKLLVKVRWQFDGCKYVAKNEFTGSSATLRHLFYKEVDVPVSWAAGKVPAYAEVHFYPDGSVRVQMTEEISPPQLFLNERRKEKSLYPRCANGKKPS